VKTESRAYTDATYKEFLAIDSGEYKEKVRFVDLNRDCLNALSLLEYVRVMNAYAEALFELGKFTAHIEVADELIEISIVHNVGYVDDKDLYQDSLFQKAASMYNLAKLDEAIYILRELLKINPDNESARLFLINCHVRERETTLHITRKISITAILLSACIIAVELFLVRPRYPDVRTGIELTRNIMFIFGVGILIIGELVVRYRALSEVYTFTRRRRDR
jgi:tetratricopeptide (TPR) repeat protein